MLRIALAIGLAAISAPHTYTLPGTYEAATESVIDSRGEEWGYYSDIPDGGVIVTFKDNGTPGNIYDDIIIEVERWWQ